MGKLNQAQLAQSTSLGFRLGKQKKFVRDHGGSGNARVFQLNRVVDTPRRARASIRKGVDDDVTFVSQLLEKIRSGAGHFSSRDDLNPFVSLLEKLTHMSEKFVGIGLVVVQETNALMAQAAVFSGSEPSPFGDSGRRWIDNPYQLSCHVCALRHVSICPSYCASRNITASFVY